MDTHIVQPLITDDQLLDLDSPPLPLKPQQPHENKKSWFSDNTNLMILGIVAVLIICVIAMFVFYFYNKNKEEPVQRFPAHNNTTIKPQPSLPPELPKESIAPPSLQPSPSPLSHEVQPPELDPELNHLPYSSSLENQRVIGLQSETAKKFSSTNFPPPGSLEGLYQEKLKLTKMIEENEESPGHQYNGLEQEESEALMADLIREHK
nr:hypothetical protein [Abalone asfa-like virus]